VKTSITVAALGFGVLFSVSGCFQPDISYMLLKFYLV
jgi:hypothetical protein